MHGNRDAALDMAAEPSIPFFELIPEKPGIEHARPILVQEVTRPDALLGVDPGLGSWLPDRPTEEVLVGVRAALSRLAMVVTLPQGFDVGATDGIGNVLQLSGLTLSFPATWREPVECPFEVVALRLDGKHQTRVALRLLTPKPPRPKWRPATTRRRGKPAVAVDLFRARTLEMARERVWPPAVADLFRRAAAGKSKGDLDRWPMELSAMLAGLMVDDVRAGRTTIPTAVRFTKVLLVTEEYYRRFRKLVDPRIRSPRALLGRLASTRLYSPRERIKREFDGLFAELHEQAGVDMSQESQVRELRDLLKRAAKAGATTRRALTRVRTQWVPTPVGFVTDELRVAKLELQGWNFVHDQKSFAGAVEQLAARAGEPDGTEPVVASRFTDVRRPIHFYVLGAPGDVRLAGPGFDPHEVSWTMPATMRISGWMAPQPPPVDPSVPARP